MPQLPATYAWLFMETGPGVLVEALALFGTKEVSGTASNPAILGWAKEVGVGRCPWKLSQPTGVRPIRLAAGGALSTNEA